MAARQHRDEWIVLHALDRGALRRQTPISVMSFPTARRLPGCATALTGQPLDSYLTIL